MRRSSKIALVACTAAVVASFVLSGRFGWVERLGKPDVDGSEKVLTAADPDLSNAPKLPLLPPPRAEPAGMTAEPEQNGLPRSRMSDEECIALRENLLEREPLPGAPGLEAKRAELLARAKAEPVLFVRTPEFAETKRGGIKYLRHQLQTSVRAYSLLLGQLTYFRQAPARARSLLLREGYLYTESPNLAFAYIERLRADHLFDEDRIWIQRGSTTQWARRNEKGRYEYVTGPEEGLPVRLLHLDRLGFDGPPRPLHRDVRALRYVLRFDQLRVTHLFEDYILADLRYGTEWVSSVIRSRGAELSLECELIQPDKKETVRAALEQNERRQGVIQALRKAIAEQVRERLPFDEPKTEIGQEDGMLRLAWRWAYLEGRKTYKYNGDRYHVYNRNGDPIVPQVCIDFMQDTLERASGSWWRRLGQPPGKELGRLDLGSEGNGGTRSVARFLEFARETPGRFEVIELSPREQIELGYKPRFFRYLAENAASYSSGDLVFIRGYTPWDEEEMHYHSFFVYETDPISLMPMLIAGNPGYPRIGTWEDEARRTPNRTVRAILKPRLEWLQSVVLPLSREEVALSPPVVVAAD